MHSRVYLEAIRNARGVLREEKALERKRILKSEEVAERWRETVGRQHLAELAKAAGEKLPDDLLAMLKPQPATSLRVFTCNLIDAKSITTLAAAVAQPRGNWSVLVLC
jgi:hypothetical protein